MNPAVVLGLNFGTHDAAAAIVCDGTVVAAAEEERFTREKQTKRFPEQAIAYCLDEAGLSARDLDRIAFFIDPRLQLLLPIGNLRHTFPASLGSLVSDIGKYVARRRALDEVSLRLSATGQGRIVPVRHHHAHAASAYLASAFDDATVVTLDGRGEYETACIFEAQGGRLRRRHSVVYPHSIGYLYSMMTRYLGFRPQRDEYKVMGLAAHGTPRLCPAVAALAAFDDAHGRLRLNLSFFDHHRRPSGRRSLFSQRLIEHLGPPRVVGQPIDDRHRDVAYAVQSLTENLVLRYVAYARRTAPSKSLCMAGGVALNAVANRVIIESGLFDAVFIQPAANDAGTSLGAALYVSGSLTGIRPMPLVQPALLGPHYSQREIEEALRTELPAGFTVEMTDKPAQKAAQLLAQDHVIGWFQGRCEFGPRALGNRSILANPAIAANTSRVNALIKRREEFRPLAPAVLEERAGEYFEIYSAGRSVYPFMLATVAVKEHRASQIPAVIHTDGSARLQTVSRMQNLEFWSLLSEFDAMTGIPVVLNTSFNGPDEPIVCTPKDAIQTLQACRLDALVMGNFVVRPVGRL